MSTGTKIASLGRAAAARLGAAFGAQNLLARARFGASFGAQNRLVGGASLGRELGRILEPNRLVVEAISELL